MAFEADGKLKSGSDNKPRKPAEWPSAVYHHIIPWNVLRAFWNLLVDNVTPLEITKKKGKRYVGHQKKPMERYLRVVGFESQAAAVVEAIWEGKFRFLSGAVTEDLDWRLCWQPFNLVVGPRDRPGHAPDPESRPDFPPMAPPNGSRASELNRAAEKMQAYLDTNGGVIPLGQALDLLENAAARYPEIVPEHDVNWFALRQHLFWQMTNVQRKEFARMCSHYRGSKDAEAVYEMLYGNGV